MNTFCSWQFDRTLSNWINRVKTLPHCVERFINLRQNCLLFSLSAFGIFWETRKAIRFYPRRRNPHPGKFSRGSYSKKLLSFVMWRNEGRSFVIIHRYLEQDITSIFRPFVVKLFSSHSLSRDGCARRSTVRNLLPRPFPNNNEEFPWLNVDNKKPKNIKMFEFKKNHTTLKIAERWCPPKFSFFSRTHWS